MTAVARGDRAYHNVASPILTAVQIVVVASASTRTSRDKVKPVLMRQTQSVSFRSWHDRGLRPNQVVAKNPPDLLHGYRETRWNEQQLLVLQITARGTPPAPPLSRVPLPPAISNAGPACEARIP